MIQRTGFGKSLCFQFPATQFSGVTVIFSPLIALMRDQVESLRKRGISAACINSEQDRYENQETIQQAIDGKIKLLYIAPERQENYEWQDAVRKMNLSMIVIDEAHTISVWGHDFRPAFRRIINLVNLLPNSLPVLATTATALKAFHASSAETYSIRLTSARLAIWSPILLISPSESPLSKKTVTDTPFSMECTVEVKFVIMI